MTERLPEHAKQFVDGKNFVVLGTLNADGSPQLSILWVARDGDDLLLSTVVGRQKERNLRRDPRVSVIISDPKNPYRYVEVRGTASLTETQGRELIDQLSQKYRGGPYPEEPGAVRVVIRITPERVVQFG